MAACATARGARRRRRCGGARRRCRRASQGAGREGFLRMKVLVTRPSADAAELAAALRARGLEPVLEPLLHIKPLPDAAARLEASLPGVQALLFTSANG